MILKNAIGFDFVWKHIQRFWINPIFSLILLTRISAWSPKIPILFLLFWLRRSCSFINSFSSFFLKVSKTKLTSSPSAFGGSFGIWMVMCFRLLLLCFTELKYSLPSFLIYYADFSTCKVSTSSLKVSPFLYFYLLAALPSFLGDWLPLTKEKELDFLCLGK